MNLYAVIRIPKSGSRSLGSMVERSLPSSRCFIIPQLEIEHMRSLHPAEIVLDKRRIFQGLLKYRVLNKTMFWKRISKLAKDGDIISGHMAYGKPQLPGWTLHYITLLRNPVDRIFSEYFYSRRGYLSRPRYRQLYHKGHAEVTGTRSFSEYLHYLCDNRERFSNPAVRFVTGSAAHNDPFSFLKENYFHFGILEKMDLFSQQLAEKFDTVPISVWENKAPAKEVYTPTADDLDMIHALYDRDISFYEETKEFIESST